MLLRDKKSFLIATTIVVFLIIAALFGYLFNKPTTNETNELANSTITVEQAKQYLSENWDSANIDGSTSMIPLHQALENMFSATSDEIAHSKTVDSFEKLINNEVDILLGVTYSDELLKKAQNSGIDFTGVEITKEGFVFLINAENPIQSLTVEQLKGIYSGKITNWKEVGGEDATIIPYQRNDDSGSQMRMNKFMDGEELIEKNYTSSSMGELSLIIAGFDSVYSDETTNSIGYNMYTFTEKQYANNNVVLLAVNDVKPTDDTIFDETYPIVIYNYMFFDKNNEFASKFAENLYVYLISDEGQKLISDAGYVNIKDKLDRNQEAEAPYEPIDFMSFHNENYTEFYDVSEDNKRIVYTDFAEFALSHSIYKDNVNAQEYLTRIFNAGLISSRVGAYNDRDYIMLSNIWMDASLDPEDFFNIKYDGLYYSDLQYYFLEDKYVLKGLPKEDLAYFYDFTVDDGEFSLDDIATPDLEIPKDQLENLAIRSWDGEPINSFNDITYKYLFADN